jgi:hypothetical protein
MVVDEVIAVRFVNADEGRTYVDRERGEAHDRRVLRAGADHVIYGAYTRSLKFIARELEKRAVAAKGPGDVY